MAQPYIDQAQGMAQNFLGAVNEYSRTLKSKITTAMGLNSDQNEVSSQIGDDFDSNGDVDNVNVTNASEDAFEQNQMAQQIQKIIQFITIQKTAFMTFVSQFVMNLDTQDEAVVVPLQHVILLEHKYIVFFGVKLSDIALDLTALGSEWTSNITLVDDDKGIHTSLSMSASKDFFLKITSELTRLVYDVLIDAGMFMITVSARTSAKAYINGINEGLGAIGGNPDYSTWNKATHGDPIDILDGPCFLVHIYGFFFEY